MKNNSTTKHIKYADIKPYIEKKLISERKHPENSDICIFNYTAKCQFSKAWDDITMQCRGLIINIKTNEILARPFSKFFNYEEHIAQGKSIPNEIPIITEKMDGSLGIMYALNGKPWIATRGSFTSEQAIWATKWWRENKEKEAYSNDITHLFEIIYPENRIVVDYDFSGLVHIASILTSTGKQIEPIDVQLPIKKVEHFSYSDISTLSSLKKANSEGFVVFFLNANLRLKIKFPEYIRLHKIVTGLSEIGIWEAMKDGTVNTLLNDVPDEFYKWFSEVKIRISNEYDAIQNHAVNDFNNINKIFGNRFCNRKEFAAKAIHCKYSDILFSMLDKKDYSQLIWKFIRPTGSKTFLNDIDG